MSDVIDIATGRRAPHIVEPDATAPSQDSGDSRLSDAEGRARALDIARSWIVEAPAGSGKTGLLIQRALALLASPAVSAPEQVLAITFTRAATEEVRSRILGQLREARDDAPVSGEFQTQTRALALAVLDRDRQLDWRLLEQPRRLRVQTIDGLCAEIVRSLPSLAGGAATLQPTEDAEPLFREAAAHTLLRLGDRDTPGELSLSAAIRDLLLHRDGDLAGTEALLANMLVHREQWADLLPHSSEGQANDDLDRVTLPRLNSSLRGVLCRSLAELAGLFPGDTLDRLAGLAQELAEAPPHASRLEHPLRLCRDLAGAPAPEADLLPVWQALLHLLVTKAHEWRATPNSNHIGVMLTKPQRASLNDILTPLRLNDTLREAVARCLKLPPPVYPEADWDFVKILLRVLGAALVELGAVFQEQGRCDFVEFSITARRALARAHTEAEPLEIVSGIRHLLVDEVQDTSSPQYDLLQRLTEGWNGRSRTLFLVGDPKQSIYIFRQARVERFTQIMHSRRFGGLAIEPISLTANFRSQATLVRAANATFAPIFDHAAGPEDPVYTPAVATRAAGREHAGDSSFDWHLDLLPADKAEQKLAARRARRAAARSTRALLQSWIARPLPSGRTQPWRTAVLVQNRRSLEQVTRALRSDPPLPFHAVDIEELGRRREILDLLSLTRALLHPADRTAWLAVLRAPWCGLMLADLHQLTGADDPELRSRTVLRLLTERAGSLSHDGAARVARVMPVLQRATELIGELRFPDLVERTWRSLGGDRYLDTTALENIRTLFRLLRSIDQEHGFLDYDQLQRRIAKLRAAPSAAPAQIDLMTIHGAKGLEWDAVVLLELDRATPTEQPELLLWEELGNGDGVLLAPVQQKGDEATPLQSWLLHLRNARLEAERRRLFYVAATRAREQLHLFGSAAPHSKGTKAAQRRSLLHAAWPAAKKHLPPAADIFDSGLSEPSVLSLAASADDTGGLAEQDSRSRPPQEKAPIVLERVPAGFQPFAPVLPVPHAGTAWTAPAQPHASPLARATGNVVHALLEYSALEAASGASLPALAEASATWRPRVEVLLRDQGIGLQEIAPAADRVHTALERTLASPLGQWILAPRPEARNELGLTTWDTERQRFRIDRVFLAGDRPLVPGASQLWIVDYKTSSQGSATLDSFLESEQSRHRDQLERYASLLRSGGSARMSPIALGLWFPLVGRFVWWHAPEGGTLALSPWHIVDAFPTP